MSVESATPFTVEVITNPTLLSTFVVAAAQHALTAIQNAGEATKVVICVSTILVIAN
jgi:hypothetical protein